MIIVSIFICLLAVLLVINSFLLWHELAVLGDNICLLINYKKIPKKKKGVMNLIRQFSEQVGPSSLLQAPLDDDSGSSL